jgi:Fe-S cluster biogenesis protein NfuA
MTNSCTNGVLAVPGAGAGRVEERVAALDRLLKADGGGLELVAISPRGVVRVRFTGLCVQCPLRPITATTIVEPSLAELPEVAEVEVDRVRISLEARQRIAQALGAGKALPVSRFEQRVA